MMNTMRNRMLLAAALVTLSAVSPAPTFAAGAEISAPEALEATTKGALKLIDIRRPEEWRETGVAKGAIRIDMQHPRGAPGFVEEVLKQTGGDKAAPIGLICRTGNRTTVVQRHLEAQGFTNIVNVKEGMAGSGAGPGWIKRGLPIEDCKRC